MAIPTYESCLLPALKAIADGGTCSTKELTKRVEAHFNLPEDEREQMLPSGQQRTIVNRIGWAKTYLKNAGLLANPSRGQVQITESGRALLSTNPASLSASDLMAIPSFVEFSQRERDRESDGDRATNDQERKKPDQTPDEAIEAAYHAIRDALADEILEQVSNSSPTFFERLVLDVLLAMGYGGAIPDAGRHVGRAGDGGIDGIINEDKLGLDIICVQAKRWRDIVGRPHVQAFAGSMEAHRAKKGVMITTSTFSRDARDFVDRIERKIVLIDGQQLAQLMIDYNVGVATSRTYTIKKIDSDYFLDSE